MIRRIYFSGIVVLCLLVGKVLAETSSASADRPFIRLSTALITPYQSIGERGELEGVAIPLVECLMQALHYDYKIEVLPWARAQRNVELGESDAFFVASQNPTRDTYAVQSEPLFSGKRSWYLREGYSVEPESEQFKKEAMVGTVFGTNMHRMLAENFNNVVTKTTEEDLIALLKIGRVDAILLTDLMYEHTIKFIGMENPPFKKFLAEQKPLGVYFGKRFLDQHSGFLQQFNALIPECKQSVAKH